MNLTSRTTATAATIFIASALPLMAAEFRAGAARIDITPATNAALPMAGYGSRVEGFKGVHDPLYVRALVVDDGSARAAIVSVDMLTITENFWKRMTQRIEREAGVPSKMILLASTHSHAAPSVRAVKPEFEVRWKPWMVELEDKIVRAVVEAKGLLKPARYGAGTGKAYVNTNRRARMASGAWGLGVNPEGPSDKTVSVIKFESLAGEPIAIFFNYCVHGTVTGPRNYEVSGDLPGAAERHVEQQFGGRAVALFTSGTAGDQNAIYGPGNDWGQVAILGRILGEEVVRVASTIRTTPHARIRGAQQTVTCPGRTMTPESKPSEGKISFVDADPVSIRVSLLMVGHLALTGISGEVLTRIGTRVKAESPFAFTTVSTHANGAIGYIPDDASYDQVSYEIWVTRLKPGCAETAITSTLREMMDQM